MCLRSLAGSSTYLNAISNRLAASSTRSRLLGMIVGSAISSLLDDNEKRLNFDADEMDTDEVRWYMRLTEVSLQIGAAEDVRLDSSKTPSAKTRKPQTSKQSVTKSKPNAVKPTSKVLLIEEVTEDNDDPEKLTPYQKPDSDQEDEDEDPTLINRVKPSAPV